MKKCQDSKERKLYVADFETTVDKDPTKQTETEVWAASICPVLEHPSSNDVYVFNNIYEFVNHLEYHIEDDAIVFFHNAKFDLSFLLGELSREGFTPAMSWEEENKYAPDWQQNMMPNTYKVGISQMGMWYTCRVNFENKSIEFRDSAKKIPMELREIAKAMGLSVQKLYMEYQDTDEKQHKPFQVIDGPDLDYILNDVLILSEAMYIVWYQYGLTGITIGADCMNELKKLKGPEFDVLFPDMYNYWLDEHGCPDHMTAYDYCVKGYHGGWVWRNEMADGVVFKSDKKYTKEMQKEFDKLVSKNAEVVEVSNICVADVNSLYPSSQSSESGNEFPYGYPTWHHGEPKKSEIKHKAIFRRFKCRFKLKKGYLPFVHIRDNYMYNANECLKTSDVRGGRYYTTRDGEEHDTLREYVMTQPDFELFQKHYNISDYEPVDYLTFERQIGIFDDYINKFKQWKIEATKEHNPAKRLISKLLLNNCYGKLSQSDCSSRKMIRFEDGVMKFDTFIEFEKQPIYIPAGAYITSFAMVFTVTAAQANYYEGEYKGTVYSDTDSIHILGLEADEIKGVEFHPTDFCKWDLEESSCAYAIYAKLKTYIEISTESDFETVTKSKEDDTPWFKLIVKAAGLGKAGKKIFTDRLFLDRKDENKLYLDQFQPGLEIENANLKARQVKGGIVLTPSSFRLS